MQLLMNSTKKLFTANKIVGLGVQDLLKDWCVQDLLKSLTILIKQKWYKEPITDANENFLIILGYVFLRPVSASCMKNS